jgi:hypothetical protein
VAPSIVAVTVLGMGFVWTEPLLRFHLPATNCVDQTVLARVDGTGRTRLHGWFDVVNVGNGGI